MPAKKPTREGLRIPRMTMHIGCLESSTHRTMATWPHGTTMHRTCALDQGLGGTPQNPFKKDRPLSADAHRFAMVRLARRGGDRWPAHSEIDLAETQLHGGQLAFHAPSLA